MWLRNDKPLPKGCTKKQDELPNWKKFDLILGAVDLDDTVCHLFVLDIRFNFEQTDAKTPMYNEILYIALFLRNKRV